MKRNAGFTMVELVIAILIGTILTGIALKSFQNVQSRFAVQGAKRAYMTLHQRARSMAVESGKTVLIVMYTNQDSVAMVTQEGGTWEWSEQTHFENQFNVQVRTPGNASFYLCMTPRGYADYSCGSWGALNSSYQATFADTFRVEFWQAADSASVLVLPMGQLVGE